MKKALSLILAVCLLASLCAFLSACTPEEQKPVDSNGTETKEYTYNASMSTFPTNWNPHIQQTETDSVLLGYISAGFYGFDYNEDETSYALLPLTATAFPVDVTSEYVGQLGVAEGDTAKAWRIALRHDLKWQDGTAIKAADFVTSAKLLLDPIAKNYRADSLYNGSMVVYGSKNFFNSKALVTESIINADFDNYFADAEGNTLTNDAVLAMFAADGTLTINGMKIMFSLDTNAMWFSGSYSIGYYDLYTLKSNILEAYKAGTVFTDDNGTEYKFVEGSEENWASWSKIPDSIAYKYGNDYRGYTSTDEYPVCLTIKYREACDAAEDGYIPMTADILKQLISVSVANGCDYAGAWEEWSFQRFNAPEYTWDDGVGVIAKDEYTLDIVIEKPLSGFYLYYALTDSWLVNETLYKACESVTDGVYSNSYGTTAATTISYGPYKLASFESDKQFKLVKNPTYFEYNDSDDYYQTTAIQYDYVKEDDARLELFLSGKLDTYGLTAENMKDYASSAHTYYTKLESTFFVALNPDIEAAAARQTAGVNKTILSVMEMRQALSFSLNRAQFALATAPTNTAAYGVYSGGIIADPDTGVAYRDTPEAKQVLVKFWGLENDIGEGKMYADVDAAIESITGYNPTKAKTLFDAAYDKAVSEGLMKETDRVVITVGASSWSSSFYSKGYEFLKNCWTEAVKGTKLEGKLDFDQSENLGNAFADKLRDGSVDLLFGVGWTGSALDPYNLMEAYTTAQYQYNSCWDTSKENITLAIDGVDYTASVLDWTTALSGDKINIVAADGTIKEFSAGPSDDIPAVRLEILAALENSVLETYHLLPLIDDSNANLKGMQIEYYKEDYLYGVGRGGVKYMTYNYTDAEWDAFVASNSGVLNYK